MWSGVFSGERLSRHAPQVFHGLLVNSSTGTIGRINKEGIPRSIAYLSATEFKLCDDVQVG